ncbi:MAG: tetratricopeptide repeat protein, partial [Acidobacteriaceae bacterium]|nr:tetratricopeptide repeat protein [Acidobacteriaceae bacterium]
LYFAAQALEPARRSAFLAAECARELDLQSEVESLLRYAEHPEPAIAVNHWNDASGPSLKAGSLLSGRFRIERLLGAGGMGEVYEAFDAVLGERVALKTIRPGIFDREEAKERFVREVQSAKKIAHPNVCRIHDLHRDDSEAGNGLIYLTMEMLEGETLRARLEQGGLPLESARTLAEQLCKAMEAAHQAGVVHCDFKSENIILTRTQDGELRAVVTDFGLARPLTEESATAALSNGSRIIGTPAYLAPEQLLGLPISQAVDIYALGVVLYETVTGAQPFTGDSASAIVEQRLLTPAPRPSAKLPGLPRAWDTAISGCLEYFPTRRFGKATEVWKAICEGHVSRLRVWRRTATAALLVAALAGLVLWKLAYRANAPGSASAGGMYLAILPFRTLAGDEALRYRAEGIADDLTARLFQFPDLHLASRTAVDGVKGWPPAHAARMLGANMLVQGSLENAVGGDEIRAIVSLEDVRNQRLLWTDRFTGSTRDLLGLEDQISARLIRALNVSPIGQQMAAASTHATENAEAYDSYLKGRTLLRNKRDEPAVQAAIGLYNTAVSRDPHFGLAYASLADACTYMYDLKKDSFWLEKAQHEAVEAVRWNPEAPESHTALGSAYLASGRTNEAIVELKRALELAPRSDEANRRLASAFSQAGNKDEALRYYRRAIDVNPYYWQNYNELGWAYLTLGRYNQALESYIKVTQMVPELPVGYNNIAAIYMYQGQYQKAIGPLNQAIKLRPEVLAYANLATCYYEMGEYHKAIENGERAVALDPKNDLAVGNLADAYDKSGDAGEAKSAYQKAVQLAYASLQANPRDVDTVSRLALYYAKQHQNTLARQFIQRARAGDPTDPDLLFDSAIVESLAGNQRAALRDLNVAVEKGYAVARIQSEPDLNALRQTPAYRVSLAAWRAAKH